jgi:hypothetical protein
MWQFVGNLDDLVCFEGEHHEILRPKISEVVTGRESGSYGRGTIGFHQGEATRLYFRQVITASENADLFARVR